MAQNIQNLGSYQEVTVFYDSTKNDLSTAVDASVAVGDVVTLKDLPHADGRMIVCRPETATLENTKFVVSAVSPEVNEYASGSSGVRKGGNIKAIPFRTAVGFLNCSVAATASAQAPLGCVDGSFALDDITATSIDTPAKQGAFVGWLTVANAGTAAVRGVMCGISQ